MSDLHPASPNGGGAVAEEGGAEGKLLAIRLFDAVVTLLLALELYLAFSLR